MKTRLKSFIVLITIVLLGHVSHATEVAARVKNYDLWRDIPGITLLDKGNEYWHADKIDSALVCFVILSNRYSEKQSEKEKKISCGATVGVANLYMNKYFDYQLAYRYLLKAEKIATRNHFEKQLADIYTTYAALTEKIDNLYHNFESKEDLSFWKKAYYQAIKSNELHIASQIITCLISLSGGSGQMNEIGKELQSFSKLDIPDSIPQKQFAIKLCEGTKAFLSKDFEKALEIYEDLSQTRVGNLDSSTSSEYNFVGMLLGAITLDSLHRHKEELLKLENIEKIAIDKHIDDAKIEILWLLRNYYYNHGNTLLAKEYELKYFKAKDEFINRSKLLSIEQQKFLLELEEMGEEVKALEGQKRARELIIIGIVLLTLLVIGALIYLWRNYQNTKQRNLLLFKKNQKLLALEAQEKERKTLVKAETKKYKSSPMDDSAKEELLQQLYNIMQSCKEIFEEGFTLDQLAMLAEANPNYVSQVINEKKGCNFNAFVNEYRIKEACRRLSDKGQFGDFTIEAIGQSVGFKSRANFTATFKKFTGMTPTAYQRLANTEKSPQSD
jgi:AraC-like DNA-binding protein